MLYQQKAIQVTSDDPGCAGTLAALAALYPYPDTLDRPFVRANMIASVDGASSVEGTSGQLGSDTDRALFRVLRGLADVIVVGARTALTENYHQPEPDTEFVSARRGAGQPDAPILALVSNTLTIDPGYRPLTSPATVVLTCAAASADRRRSLLDRGATLVDCGHDQVEFAAVVAHLGDRGLTRILCEGGPRLLGTVIADDLLDELCLTTSPVLTASNASRIATGGATPPRSMRSAQVLSDDEGYFYTRWTRAQ